MGTRCSDLEGNAMADIRPMQSIDAETAAHAADRVSIPLHVEELEISRRRVETGRVRVETVTQERDHRIDEALTHHRVEIEHVPVGRYVDVVPAVREEAGVTIMPVVEEVLVVERKLLLREEVHIRRVETTEHHVETVKLREQQAVITRTPAGERAGSDPANPPTLLDLETHE